MTLVQRRIRHALILAAGRGMRMMPLTEALPKAMAPYNGTTLIADGIGRVSREVDNVHVTVGHLKAKLAEHVIGHGAATVINTEGHGNAWWVYNTFLTLLDEPLLVLTCDNVTDLELELLAAEYDRVGRPACMLVPVVPVPGLDGDYIFPDQDDQDIIVNLSRTEPAAMYCSGIQILNPAAINQMTRPVEDFGDVWTQLITRRELRRSAVYPSSWISFDTIAHLHAVRSEPHA